VGIEIKMVVLNSSYLMFCSIELPYESKEKTILGPPPPKKNKKKTPHTHKKNKK
jgi:hypothetical protein